MLDSKKLTKYRKQLEELEARLDADSRMRADLLPEVMKANGDLSDVPTHPADHDVEELTAEIGVAQIQDHLRERSDRLSKGPPDLAHLPLAAENPGSVHLASALSRADRVRNCRFKTDRCPLTVL